MKKEIHIKKKKNHKKYNNNNDNRNKPKNTKGKTISYDQHTSKPDDTHLISARQQLNLLQKILCSYEIVILFVFFVLFLLSLLLYFL